MVRRGLLVTLLTALLALIGGGIAAAACPPPTTNTSAGAAAAPVDASALPKGFPEDLRQFIAGSDEFRQGPWFSGPCAAKGGDLGAYINAAMAQENRLLYWSTPDDQKTDLITLAAPLDLNLKVEAEQMVADGQEPPDELLPKVFPDADEEYRMPSGVCADDLEAVGTPASNAWGFTWATAPDPMSLEGMKTAAAAHGAVPDKAWSDPCAVDGSNGMYCAHAFFVDCDRLTARSAVTDCGKWNQAVGNLYGGTANWIEKNQSFGDRLGTALNSMPAFQAGKWVVDANVALASGVTKLAGATVEFAKNPTGFAGKWANDFKAGSIDMSTKTLESMTCSHRFDPTTPKFRALYAISMAFGILVMAIMAIATVVRSGHKGSPKELAESLFQYLPISILVVTFVPGFAWFILGVTEAATDALTGLVGESTGSLIANVSAFGEVTSENFAGGDVGGMILFSGLLVGAFLLLVGMYMHQYGMPLSLLATAISLFMLMHPKYRKKALGPIYVFLGLALSVPLLFLLLTGIFDTANAAWGSGEDSPIGKAGEVLFVALGLALAALAPWALLKWAPLLPTKADSEDIGTPGPGMGGEIVGAAGNYMMYQRGGGGAGGGVGGEQPVMRSDVGGGQNGSGLSGVPDGGGQPGPMQSAYQQRGDMSSAGQHSAGSGDGEIAGARAGMHGSGEAAGRGAAGAESAAATGGKAAAGAATGGVATGVAVAAQAASAAITKAKSTADSAAETADDN